METHNVSNVVGMTFSHKVDRLTLSNLQRGSFQDISGTSDVNFVTASPVTEMALTQTIEDEMELLFQCVSYELDGHWPLCNVSFALDTEL